LETKDRKAASRLLEIKRQTVADPGFNQFILKSCLSTQDPLLAKRTWQNEPMQRGSTADKDLKTIQRITPTLTPRSGRAWRDSWLPHEP
jgi:hypothetical protein